MQEIGLYILVSGVRLQIRLDIFPRGVQFEGLGVAQQASELVPSLSLLGFLLGCLVLCLAH